MMKNKLSIILTTSPIPLNPSIFVIQSVVESFFTHLFNISSCHLIVCMDGYKEGDQSRPKMCRVTAQERMNYELYKKNLKSFILEKWSKESFLSLEDFTKKESEYILVPKSPKNEEIKIHLEEYLYKGSKVITFYQIIGERIGFALGVKECLEFVSTEYVLVAQHDWAFEKHIPIHDILKRMQENEHLNYIAFISRSNLSYSIKKGVNQSGIKKVDSSVYYHPDLKDFSRIYFWYDRTHLCKKQTYKEIVFGHGYFKRGNFIEDVFGHVMMNDIRSSTCLEEMITRHNKYGCYLYEPSNEIYLRHLNGRKYKTFEQKMMMKKMNHLELSLS